MALANLLINQMNPNDKIVPVKQRIMIALNDLPIAANS
jgi:hypothetical protein